ncbi:MAG TPA: hypothetical protein VG889_10605 [Rhizomicrobium sp.]|nr:hypothetical protein [Rhizomicrobium sp.]
MSTVTLHSRLPRAQCVERLKGEIDPWWKLLGYCQAIGGVGEERFWLVRRRVARNSFQTLMTGRLIDDGAGTTIQCRFGMTRYAQGFLALMALMLATFLIEGATRHGWPGAGLVLGMAAFVVAFAAFGRWLARGEEAFLTEFVCELCDARIVADPVA